MMDDQEDELVELAWQELAIRLGLNSEHCGWFKSWLKNMLIGYGRGIYDASQASCRTSVIARSSMVSYPCTCGEDLRELHARLQLVESELAFNEGVTVPELQALLADAYAAIRLFAAEHGARCLSPHPELLNVIAKARAVNSGS